MAAILSRGDEWTRIFKTGFWLAGWQPVIIHLKNPFQHTFFQYGFFLAIREQLTCAQFLSSTSAVTLPSTALSALDSPGYTADPVCHVGWPRARFSELYTQLSNETEIQDDVMWWKPHLCKGNPPVTDGLPWQRPSMGSYDFCRF